MMRFAAIMTLALTAANQTPPRNEILVEFPEYVTSATCELRLGARPVMSAAGLHQRFRCDTGPLILSCDLKGAEPFDWPLTAWCDGARPKLTPAEPILIRNAKPANVDIEWLNVTPDGVQTLAKRTVVSDNDTTIFVGSTADRLIRMSRQGVSPVTLAARSLASGVWALPKGLAGGEMVIVEGAADVLPNMYELTGPQAVELTARQYGVASVPGLPAGEYGVRGVYDEGLLGDSQTVRVAAGASTIVSFGREEVGAIETSVDESLCEHSRVLRIMRVATHVNQEARQVTAQSAILQIDHDGRCNRRIAGLAPGVYETALLGSEGVLATHKGEVHSQSVSPAYLRGAAAEVAGTLTWRSRPLVNAQIEFTPSSDPDRVTPHIARTDPAGMYKIDLPQPGLYNVMVTRGSVKLLGQTRDINVVSGRNVLNWDMDGGLLKVRLEGADPQAPAALTLTQIDPVQPGMYETSAELEARLHEYDFDALGFGIYSVQAHQNDAGLGRRVSPRVTTELSATRSEQHVMLSLRPYAARLLIVDEQGQPVSGASVIGPDGMRSDETSPGIYSLADALPGAPLLVKAAGFSPACKVAPASADARVTLQRGRTVWFAFFGNYDLARPAGRVAWGAAECDVPLHDFEYQRMAPRVAGENVFVLRHFAAAGGFWYTLGAFDGPDRRRFMSSDADGVVRVQMDAR